MLATSVVLVCHLRQTGTLSVTLLTTSCTQPLRLAAALMVGGSARR
jgi:hypothetical protein